MKTAVLSGLLVGFVLAHCCVLPAQPRGAQRFRGAWFEIEYPRGFRVELSPLAREKLRKNADEKPNEATFLAPDGRAQFYVFSPLWNGTPALALPQKNEIVIARRETVSTARDGAKSRIVARWWTVRARDGRYFRSVSDVENTTLNTRRTFSFRYANEAARRRYARLFARFKASLQQFSD